MQNSIGLIKYVFFLIFFIPFSLQSQISERHSMDEVINQTIFPHLKVLLTKLEKERLDFELDGVRTFDKPHNFLPGKIAIAFSYLLLETPQDNPDFAKYMRCYSELADMTVNLDNEKWGVYYYMLALYRLQEANLLEEAISKNTLEKLKLKLDWRNFVSTPEYKLQKGIPTNYYGVAFSIARLRFLMGWESEVASKTLLEIMLSHIEEHSGEYGFSDETQGEGRFDRYSIVLIAELCARFLDTNSVVPEKLNGRMRKSVDFILPLMNPEGVGLQYGRSIGPYGDGIFVEILSAAAMMGILNTEEMDMAYAFQTKVSERLMKFWYDADMGAINFWEKGRVTQSYRNKSRILDENLSLVHQHLSGYNFWRKLGYTNKLPSTKFNLWLKTLPRYDITWFAKGDYERGHLTVRDNARIIELPLVGGAKPMHGANSYFPIPYSVDMLQGSPMQIYPQLLPRLTMENGIALEPLSFFKKITTEQKGSQLTVQIQQNELDQVLSEHAEIMSNYVETPTKNNQFSIETTYQFDSGIITRTDCITPLKPLKNVELSMEFAGFSKDAVLNGSKVIYGSGIVTSFETTGYQKTTVETLEMNPKYSSPIGAMTTLVKVSSKLTDFSEPITLTWTMKYRN